jgi:endonuclease-3 related protein
MTAVAAVDAIGKRLRAVFAQLDEAYGDEMWHWSPSHVRDPMEIFVGAVLVQHTAWQNAERALHRLRDAGMLSSRALIVAPDEAIVELIRVSGTPTVKLRRLRALATTIEDAGGLAAFLAFRAEELRARLLATHGVGRETADAIALYAAGRRVFVVDAYTMRLFRRLGIGPAAEGYEDWRGFFEQTLPDADVAAFQRYHAHIVLHAKAVCRVRPRCDACPLRAGCSFGLANSNSGFA